MTAHELARKLLAGPDAPVVYEYDDSLILATNVSEQEASREILPMHLSWKQPSYALVPFGGDYAPAEKVIVIA